MTRIPVTFRHFYPRQCSRTSYFHYFQSPHQPTSHSQNTENNPSLTCSSLRMMTHRRSKNISVVVLLFYRFIIRRMSGCVFYCFIVSLIPLRIGGCLIVLSSDCSIVCHRLPPVCVHEILRRLQVFVTIVTHNTGSAVSTFRILQSRRRNVSQNTE